MWPFFKNNTKNSSSEKQDQETATAEENLFSPRARKEYDVAGRIRSISEYLIIPEHIKVIVEKEMASTDPLTQFVTKNLWEEFCKKLDTKEWFDVCYLTNIVRKYDIKHSGSSKEVYEKIRELHCVDWVKMPNALYNAMPDYLNYVLSSGKTTLQGYDDIFDVDAREVNEMKSISNNAS